MNRIFKWIVFTGVLLKSTLLFSQDIVTVHTLLDTANSDTVFFLKRVKLAEQALKYAETAKAQKEILDANLTLGKIYLSNSSYDKAMIYLRRAHDIIRHLGLKNKLPEVDYLQGRLNLNIKNFEEAKKQFHKTINEAAEINDSAIIGDAYSSLGIIYSKQGKFDSSMVFYQKVLQVFDQLHLTKKKQPAYINIGDYFLELKQPDSALFYFNLSLQLDSVYQTRAISITYLNIGLAYTQKKDYRKAFQYYRKSLNLSQRYSYRYVSYACYLEMSRAFESLHRIDSSFYYFKQYAQLKDSVYNEKILEKIHQYQTFVELEKKDKELALTKSQIEIIKQKERVARFKNYLLFFVGIFILLLGLILFWRQQSINKSKVEVMKKNREIQLIKIDMANREIEAKKAENERLTEELRKKKQDLLNFGLDISRKNKFFKTLKTEIKKAMNAEEQNQKVIMRNFYLLLQNHMRINDDLSLFQQNIEDVNQEFVTKLTREFPNLTQLEINLCGMIKIGLSIKEISAIRNVSPKSVEMSRYRLRKKLNLPKNVDLTRFLKEF